MKEIFYSSEEITEHIKTATLAGLQDVELYEKYKDSLASTLNGCGPDWLCKSGRKDLTSLFEVYKPAFDIHDLHYQFDKPRDFFTYTHANLQLGRNVEILGTFTGEKEAKITTDRLLIFGAVQALGVSYFLK